MVGLGLPVIVIYGVKFGRMSDVTVARMWYTYVGTSIAMLYVQYLVRTDLAVPVILRAVGVAVGSLLPRAPVVE